MELFATGFNAWNQLFFDHGQEGSHGSPEPEDIRSFTSVLRDERIEQVDAFLSYTRVYNKPTRTITQYPSLQHLLFEKDHESKSSWSFTLPFDGDNTRTDKGPTTIIQLVSYETGFAALSSTGTVFTWGDERYSACLGREVTDETPATHPYPVTALEALPTGKITKIAAGGTILAALTEGDDLYAWGQPPRAEPFRTAPVPPKSSHQDRGPDPSPIHEFKDEETTARQEEEEKEKGEAEPSTPFFTTLTSDPTPVDINNWSDIADIAIGDRHLLALTTEGEVFAIGDNINGQLGLPEVKHSTDIWTKVDINTSEGAVITGVVAGPRNSFVIVRSSSNTHTK
ncbi:E3 ubiquitin-protein ligase HERC2 [Naviculisporaceae sp. PSN 640]